MEKIKWDPSFGVNILDVDDNLKKIIELINKIIDQKKSKKCDDEQLIETFADLTEVVRNYFPTEENYLTRYRYPEARQHMKEHKKFVKKKLFDKEEVSQIIQESNNFADKNGWTKTRHKNYPTIDNEITQSWNIYSIIYKKIYRFF